MARNTDTKSPAPKVDMAQYMADLAVQALEGGQAPWSKPWSTDGRPSNFASGHQFTGNNVWIAVMTAMVRGFDRSLWLTFNQCKKLGGTVRKGETHTKFFQPLFVKEKKDPTKTKLVGFRSKPYFNVAQCEGLDVPAAGPGMTGELSADAEAMFVAWPVPVTHEGSKAYYRPSADTITLPPRDRFGTASEYACTRFHEMAHSTGHKSRLDRDGLTDQSQFGNHCYAIEELIAEFAASMLCLLTGMDRVETTDNSVAYLKNWATKIKDDPKILSQAIKAAQAAVKEVEEALPAQAEKAA